MEFGRGGGGGVPNAPHLEENGFPVHGSWIPVTPSKPEQAGCATRVHWLQATGIHGNRSIQHITQQKEASSGTVPSMQLDSVSYPGQVQRLSNQEAASGPQARVSGLNTHMQTFISTSDEQNRSPQGHFLAFTNGASTAAAAMQRAGNAAVGPFTPILLAQIDSALQQQSTSGPTLLLMNQNVPVMFAPWNNNTRHPPQMTPNGFPVPYRTNYDLNSPAKSIADVVTNGTITFQIAPVTPDQGARIQNSQSKKTVSLFANGVNQEKQDDSPAPRSLPSRRKELIELNRDQDLSQPLDSLHAIFSNPVKGKQGLSQLFDSSPTVPSTPVQPNQGFLQPLDSSPAVHSSLSQQLDTAPPVLSTPAEGNQCFSRPLDSSPVVFYNTQVKENQGFTQLSDSPPTALSTPVKESQGLSHLADSSPSVCATTVKENSNSRKGEDQGIDLNKTPPQKPPRRKKHRPKVIRDGKPKRTPKPPEAPKQATNKENPSGKRKYVRKTGQKVSSTPPSVELGETVDVGAGEGAKSCKRALNFDSEGQAGDQNPSTIAQHDIPNGGIANAALNAATSSMWNFNIGTESQAHNGCIAFNSSPGFKSTVQLAQGLEVVVENSPAGIAFDLNRSLTQMLDEYMSLPENPSPAIAWNEPPKEKKSEIPRKQNNVETMGACINGRHSRHAPVHQFVHAGEVNRTPIHQYVHAEELNHIGSPVEAGHQDHKSNSLSRLQTGVQSVAESQCHSNFNMLVESSESDHMKKGSKRTHIQIANDTHHHPMNIMEAHMQACQKIIKDNEYYGGSGNHGMHFPDINKKRSNTSCNEPTSNASPFMTGPSDGSRRATECSMNGVMASHFTVQNSEERLLRPCSFMEEVKRDSQYRNNTTMPDIQSQTMTGEHYRTVQHTSGQVVLQHTSGQLVGINTNKPQVPDSVLDQSLMERRIKQKSNGSFQVRTLPSLTVAAQQTALTSDKRQASNVLRGTQGCVEALAADNQAKVKTKRRTKKAPGPPSNSVGMNQAHLQEQRTARYDHHQHFTEPRVASLGQKSIGLTGSPSKHGQLRSSNSLPIGLIHDSQTRSNFQDRFGAGFQSQAIVPYNNAIDEITDRLECLNINGKSKIVTAHTQNAMVPYVGRMMVPYDGSSAKKRRHRAKVDLDAETNRVWKLLMWKEGSNERIDADKEKYWEEERQIFRGRADSFIARMHLVQGDRRFSRWKGSVVDSVVGVFLTQNVSDHLSSSAFMALAARFPLRSSSKDVVPNREGTRKPADGYVVELEDSICQQACDSSEHGAEPVQEKEVANSHESFGSNVGGGTPNHSKGKHHTSCISGPEMCQESPENRTDTSATVTESASLADTEDRKVLEDVVSSQISVVSSQNSTDSIHQAADRIGSSSESNSEAENQMTEFKCNQFNGSTSFMELLEMAGPPNTFAEFNAYGNGSMPSKENYEGTSIELGGSMYDKRMSRFDGADSLNGPCPSIERPNSHHPQAQHAFNGVVDMPSSAYHLHTSLGLGQVEMGTFPSSEIGERNNIYYKEKRVGQAAGNATEFTVQQKPSLPPQTALPGDLCAPINKNSVHASPNSNVEAYFMKHPLTHHNLPRETNACSPGTESLVHIANFLQNAREAGMQSDITEASEARNIAEVLSQRQTSGTQHNHSNLPNYLGDTLDVAECSSLAKKEKPLARKLAESNSKDEGCSSKIVSTETSRDTLKARKGRGESAKKQAFDWDSLRKQACYNGQKKERSSDRMDSLDWEAVRLAEVSEISDTIRERGMNNMLAERIKEFLNRLVREHGSVDLEWLRDVPPDKAKDFLLSVRGLGLKSVECVRLLTLHHLAFPVDTNVGRICVRLGWVPIQPLPESLHLHLLELYPVLENIQKYLWPRLCKLDQPTLYELHYQMITFGKVFCTKSKPNCNACPMRAECRHFASAFASARLALPGPEEKSLVSSAVPIATEKGPKVVIHPLPLPPPEGNPHSQAGSESKRCEPIIEEPATPEPEHVEISSADIEDAFWEEDPDEIPTIKLNFEEFSMNIQNYMQKNNMELQDVDMSKALVALTPEAASIPMPKLKNISRLRTEHQVYELPDSHPLLKGLDSREPDDPCSYLLAIWTPGETAQSTQPPEICCAAQPGNLCEKETCFSCNSIREANAQTVRGTLLIPCRTAMRGSFPLNGTYFQVNEVFADHDSSIQPIDVPRSWLWNLSRRTVYFGTSIPTIFKGLSTEGIQHCFWRGFVCVRGFDQKTRAPRPLMARLHFPASKIVRNNKKAPTKAEE
ncbi:protein ROS1A-like isoform X2 [Magnolia sinica]|uniref:protein ROS1A-like isoform X2 n=1 Tax=Magnolia sinica TaxID=86752 RepID=UPI0026593185|nr:protein ROS1A-like isoform X2 [Magnolia sinica]